MRFLILGCGYVGLELGKRLVKDGHEVKGVVRSQASSQAVELAGIVPYVSDCSVLAGARAACQGGADIVVFSLSARGGDYRKTYVEGMRNVLEALGPRPPRMLIYTGSASVYAQCDGEWVDENSEANPSHEKGKFLLQTEQLLERSSLVRNGRGVVLRISGIYGPDRHSLLTQLREGISHLPGTGEAWLNHIHRDDVVGAILHLIQSPENPGFHVFNLADDLPVLQRDYVSWICQQLGRCPPIYDPQKNPSDRRGAAFRNRRISNRSLRKKGWTPLFRTYREGLPSFLG